MADNATTSSPKLGKTLQFLQAVWGLGHALQSMSKAMEASLGVSGPQRFAIRLIGRSPGISPSDLAAAMRLHRSTVTGVLRRLEEQGAVRREGDPDDARRVRLWLTRAGAALDGERSPTVEAAVRRALLRVAPADADAARRVIEAITKELEREAEEATRG